MTLTNRQCSFNEQCPSRQHSVFDRRGFLSRLGASGLIATAALASGCRSYQYGHLLRKDDAPMVGSHAAGSEVYEPLVEESVAKLLGKCQGGAAVSSIGPDGLPTASRVCFVGVENKSSEELGDFKEQIYQLIDAQINQADSFQAISRRMVDSALHETRLRPDSLLVPANMQLFTAVLQREGQPVDYLLYATLTSGTTERNKSSQRDYMLTLELVDTRTGFYTKEQAEISKGYHKSPLGKLANYSLLPAGR
ncbi:MAG: penicillin-binding protein activator LpoB [Aureliella sp.]